MVGYFIFFFYDGQHLRLQTNSVGRNGFGLGDQRPGPLAVLQARGIDLHVQAGPEYGTAGCEGPYPASDTELGLPVSAIARTSGKTRTAAFIVRRGTSVA